MLVVDTTKQTGAYLDKDVTKGERYYYMAFSYDAVYGWSLYSYQSGDTTVSFDPNPNLAMEMFVRTNLGGNQGVYGTANRVVDGDRRSHHAQTSSAPDGIKVDIDLKRTRRIKELVWWQTGDKYVSKDMLRRM